MFSIKDYILEIYQTGSFSQAAANLYVSQPSLSASVKRLEARIGEPLFDRSMHPIHLTECGMEYVRTAQAIAVAEANFLNYLDEHRNCRTGSLKLGGSNLNISFILPAILHRFQERYPGITVDIMEGNIDQLQQSLQEGKLDFVLDSCEMDPDRFAEFIYKAEHLILAVPARFACVQRLLPYQLTLDDVLEDRHLSPSVDALPLRLIEGVPFISLTPETDTYKRVQRICQRENFSPHIVLSFNQQSTAFNLACANMGVTFISDTLVKNAQYRPDLVYYKVNAQESLRYIKLYKKKERRMSFGMRAFLETVREPEAVEPS